MSDHQEQHEHSSQSIWGATLTNAIVFFCVILLGCSYVLFSKLEGFPAGWVTFGPVALMIIYALIVGLARPLRLRDDHTGDNLYYMGFLFTLSSLGIALYQFNSTGAPEVIVQNFGIAIASTITGISLRIFFNQMRRDPIDVEAEARLELAYAASRVRRTLDNIVLEFNQFGRATQQIITDGLIETRLSFSEATKQLIDSLDNSTKTSINLVQSSSVEISKSLTEITSKFDDAGTKLLNGLEYSTAAVASELNQLTEKLSKLQTPDQVIEVKLTPMVQGLARVVGSFGKSTEAQSASIKEAIDAARKTLEQYASNLSIIQTQFEMKDVALESALDEIKKNAQQTLEQFVASSSVIQTQFEKRDAALGHALEEIKKNARTTVEMTADLRSKAADSNKKAEIMENKIDFVVTSISHPSFQNSFPASRTDEE